MIVNPLFDEAKPLIPQIFERMGELGFDDESICHAKEMIQVKKDLKFAQELIQLMAKLDAFDFILAQTDKSSGESGND